MMAAVLSRLSALLPHTQPWHSLARAAILIVLWLILIPPIERFYRRTLARYKTREFAVDLTYTFFYEGGIYALLVYGPVVSWIQPRLIGLNLNLLGLLPLPLAFICFMLLTDFTGYWLHRFLHTNRYLWAFHSVHHTATEVTFATSNRVHPLEQIILNVTMLVPGLLLGTPRMVWQPYLLLQLFIGIIKHAQIDWRFGPLYTILVSPVFHNLHHSAEGREHHGNYSTTFSFWDYFFGTAVQARSLPNCYGAPGVYMPTNIVGQLLTPFTMLFRGTGQAAPASSHAAPAQPIDYQPAEN